STPFARSARASSRMPVLSETERIARSIGIQQQVAAPHQRRGADVAAGFLPDVVVEVHEIGDGTRVADRRDAERGRAVIELARRPQRAAAKILLAHQRIKLRRAREGLVEIRRELESRIESVEDGRKLREPLFEELLEVVVRGGEARVVVGDVERSVGGGDEM